MKTTNLFKAVAFVAMVIVSIMNSEVKAQDRFITNEEVQNDLIVAKTIFKQSGTYLYNHMRYEFTYDDENRLTNKTASKWDGVKEKWMPYFRMSYQYTGVDYVSSGALTHSAPILDVSLKNLHPVESGIKNAKSHARNAELFSDNPG